MSEDVTCPTCHTRGVPTGHVERCQRIHRCRTEAADLGAKYDVPAVTADDFWAHLGHVATGPDDATRIVRLVLDLGWRPVVGSDPKRLWARATEPEQLDLFGGVA